MNKRLSKKIILLFVLLIISFLVIPVSFSKYTSSIREYLTLQVSKIATYTVVFLPNPGDTAVTGSMTSQEFVFDKGQALKANEFQKEGYTFSHWTTKPNGAGNTYFNEEPINNPPGIKDGDVITLYANFIRNPGTKAKSAKLNLSTENPEENANDSNNTKDIDKSENNVLSTENEDTTIDTLKGFISEDLEENKAANSEEYKNASIVEEKADEEETKQTNTRKSVV